MYYLKLAELLEAAALGLRKCHETMETCPSLGKTKIAMGLSCRGQRIIEQLGIEFVDQLEKLSVSALAEERHCGPGTIKEIAAWMEKQGKSLVGFDAWTNAKCPHDWPRRRQEKHES
jgi:hypothetical protein